MLGTMIYQMGSQCATTSQLRGNIGNCGVQLLHARRAINSLGHGGSLHENCFEAGSVPLAAYDGEILGILASQSTEDFRARVLVLSPVTSCC